MLATPSAWWPDMPLETLRDPMATRSPSELNPDDLVLALAHWRDGRSLRAIATAHQLSFRQVHQAVGRVRAHMSGDMPKARGSRDVSGDTVEAIAAARVDSANPLWN